MRPALRTLSKLTRVLSLLACVAFAPRAAAVDQTGVKISERWSVVGIIAGGDANSKTGIAVLRHNPTKRTYTLSIGDSVPTEFGFVLKSVKDRTVVVARGEELETLSFAEPSVEETESVSQTARFIDTYYKSLNAGENRNGAAATEPDPTFVPLSRFGRGADAARSRFELYREEMGQRANQDGEGFGFETLYDRSEDGDALDEPEVIRGDDLSGAVEDIEE